MNKRKRMNRKREGRYFTPDKTKPEEPQPSLAPPDVPERGSARRVPVRAHVQPPPAPGRPADLPQENTQS